MLRCLLRPPGYPTRSGSILHNKENAGYSNRLGLEGLIWTLTSFMEATPLVAQSDVKRAKRIGLTVLLSLRRPRTLGLSYTATASVAQKKRSKNFSRLKRKQGQRSEKRRERREERERRERREEKKAGERPQVLFLESPGTLKLSK